MRSCYTLIIILITLFACEKEEPEDLLCSYQYSITVTNKTEFKLSDCYLVHNNNPTCDVALDDFEYNYMDIEPFSTIVLKGPAYYNCDDEYCSGYGRFELDSIWYADLEFQSETIPYFEFIKNQTSVYYPNIDVIITSKYIDFDLEIDNQTDSIAHMMYSTLNESCGNAGLVFFELDPNSTVSWSLSTVNLGGKCPIRWGSYNFKIALYRTDHLFPDPVQEIVYHNQMLNYTIILDSLNQPRLRRDHWP